MINLELPPLWRPVLNWFKHTKEPAPDPIGPSLPEPVAPITAALPDPKDLDDAMLAACAWIVDNAGAIYEKVASIMPSSGDRDPFIARFGLEISRGATGRFTPDSIPVLDIHTTGREISCYIRRKNTLTKGAIRWHYTLSVYYNIGNAGDIGRGFLVASAGFDDAGVVLDFSWNGGSDLVQQALLSDETVKLVLCGKLLNLRARVEACGQAADSYLQAVITTRRGIILGTSDGRKP